MEPALTDRIRAGPPGMCWIALAGSWGFEPSALEDALAETLAWYRVAHPSHPGYANRGGELAIAGAA